MFMTKQKRKIKKVEEKEYFKRVFIGIFAKIIVYFNTWIRIRICITDPDPHPATQIKTDSTYGSGLGSGSATLIK
jgi:hypothetical protein